MPTTDTYTPYSRRIDASQRETWADWMPNTPATMSPAVFVEHVNSHLMDGHFTLEDLKAFEENGILPDPGTPPLYPAPGWGVIAQLLAFKDVDALPTNILTLGRNMATALDRLQVIEGRETRKAQQRETWRDWFPDSEPQHTIGELTRLTTDMGIDPVTPATLRFWQKIGLLPRPERRRRGSGTIALYPSIALSVFERIRTMQAGGFSLEEIGPLLRGQMRAWGIPDPLAIEPMMRAAALRQGALTGIPIRQVVVSFHDVTGTREAYSFDLDTTDK